MYANEPIAGLFDGSNVTATTYGTSATIRVTGHPVSLDDVGKSLVIRGGTNFIIGAYRIVSIDRPCNSWALNRPCTIGAGHGMIGRLVTQEGRWHNPVPEYFDENLSDNPARGEALQQVLEALLVVAPDILKSLAEVCLKPALLEPEAARDYDWPGPPDYLLWGHVRDAGSVAPSMGIIHGNLTPLKAAIVAWSTDEPLHRWNLCDNEGQPVEWIAEAAVQTLVYWQEKGRLPKNLMWANLDLHCYRSLDSEEAYRMLALEEHFDAGSGFVRITQTEGTESSRLSDPGQRRAKQEYKALGQQLGLTRLQSVSPRYFEWYAMRTFLSYKLREIRERELQTARGASTGVGIGDPHDPAELSAIAHGIKKIADLVGFRR